MSHEETRKNYIRRCNSNGEDVSPSVCACYYKVPQRQADNSGGYVLDYIRKEPIFKSTPFTPNSEVC